MVKRAVLFMAVLLFAGFASVALEAKSKDPTPEPTSCVPAQATLEFTQAQADLVMSSFCAGTASNNIATMVSLPKTDVERIICANRPWPTSVTNTVPCP